MPLAKNRQSMTIRLYRVAVRTSPLAVLLALILAGTSFAHPPTSLELNYGQGAGVLNVTINHGVKDPQSHYVKSVEVLRNGTVVAKREFSVQPPENPFTYSFDVVALQGDTIKVIAECSVFGSRTGEMVVSMQGEQSKSDPSILRIMSDKKLPLDLIKLPEGFRIEIFAENIPNARSLDVSPNGTVFVGTRLPFEDLGSPNGSDVYAIADRNGNNFAEPSEIRVIAEGLNNPNGVAFFNGSLYVAEITRIVRFDDVEAEAAGPAKPAVIRDGFPTTLLHGWKVMRLGPDGKLYVASGAPCNVCPLTGINGTILRMDLDGSNEEIFATGVRNSVGFDWDPITKELWFTDNGRDNLGNDVPSDELNHAPVAGLNFGFPECHSGSIPDPDMGVDKNYSCHRFVPPAWALGPHVAPLGMRFYTGSMFPAAYKNRIFIAEHGSWNRDEPIGYRIAAVEVRNNTAVGHEIFAVGWLQNGTAWGRPVDVQMIADGSLLVSDDLSGVIYRISYAA